MADDRQHDSCSGTPIRLAESGVGRVTACSCGNIHFDVEYVTLRFAPEAFKELAAMLDAAQGRLDGNGVSPANGVDFTAMH